MPGKTAPLWEKTALCAARSVQIDAIKKAEDEDCLIVRMHECRGGRANVTVSSEYPVKKIVLCNLLEHDLPKGNLSEQDLPEENFYGLCCSGK